MTVRRGAAKRVAAELNNLLKSAKGQHAKPVEH
jgi:hypothetical protein